MKLIVTIDTEEDNWGSYSRTDNPCTNIEQLLRLQELFDTYDVKPAYLITYPVVNDARSQVILKQFLRDERCELGTHCHPWNTPPFEEELNAENTMLTNLQDDLILKKITTLHAAISETFGVTPIAFRSGRFAFNSEVAKALAALDYKIDTSITPYEDQQAYLGPDFSDRTPESYSFSEDDIFLPRSDGKLVEIPLSTGYLQNNFYIANRLFKFFHQKPISRLRIIGILNKLGIVNRACLCPETNTEQEMIGIAKVFMKKDFKIVNMMFHSTSIKAGLSPFTKTVHDEERIFNRIKTLLQFTKDAGIENIRVSEASDVVRSAL
ncbi:MAG: hypothetical protein JW915_01825 [Chitinispirillaceae bacterium]|nr:hypothetical protein [Chitinispirillaceae bacterium]